MRGEEKMDFNKVIDNLEENETLIKQKREELTDIYNEQEKKFLDLFEKVKPIIIHLKNEGYHFYNDTFDCQSSNGPVIGRDNDIMFIYEGQGHLVTKYNLYTKEKKQIPLVNFFSSNSFKLAMEALLKVVTIQNSVIDEFDMEIQKAERELNEFK
jgi:hypothetical protein